MSYLLKIDDVAWPLIFMHTDSGVPDLTNSLAALRRKSCSRTPGYPAAFVALRHWVLNSPTGRPRRCPSRTPWQAASTKLD